MIYPGTGYGLLYGVWIHIRCSLYVLRTGEIFVFSLAYLQHRHHPLQLPPFLLPHSAPFLLYGVL